MIVICFITIFSCTPPNNNKIEYADRELFYFEFIDHENSQRSRTVIQYLEKELTTWDYVLIDNSTSDIWPYYTKLTQNEDVPIDSIMFPHKTIHRLILYDETNQEPKAQYKLGIAYNLPLEDGTPNVKIIKYLRKESGDWEKVVDLGIEKFDKSHFPNDQSIAQVILEHLLIYSWK